MPIVDKIGFNLYPRSNTPSTRPPNPSGPDTNQGVPIGCQSVRLFPFIGSAAYCYDYLIPLGKVFPSLRPRSVPLWNPLIIPGKDPPFLFFLSPSSSHHPIPGITPLLSQNPNKPAARIIALCLQLHLATSLHRVVDTFSSKSHHHNTFSSIK